MSTIQRIEKGKVVPRAHTLKILSHVLGLELFAIQPNSDNTELDTDELFLILLFSIALTFIPPFNILYLFGFWKNQSAQKLSNLIGKKLLSFQTITFIFFMLSICLAPILSVILTGQKTYGQFNAPFLIYLTYVITNIIATPFIYYRTHKVAL